MVVHDSVNVFGGFAPFPNTIMIPTMGLQSDVIGFRFGFGYEKGKRTLRAMSNEQFNTLNEEAESAIYKEHDAIAINFFKLEIDRWTQLQHTIIEKSVEIETMKASRTPSAMAEIIQSFNTGVVNLGDKITWENLAEKWDSFFGGKQVFNNYVNSSATQTETTPVTPGASRRPPATRSVAPISRETGLPRARQQSAQEKAEFAQVKIRKSVMATAQAKLTVLLRQTPKNPTAIKKAQAVFRQAGINFAKVSQTFKDKWGYWPN